MQNVRIPNAVIEAVADEIELTSAAVRAADRLNILPSMPGISVLNAMKSTMARSEKRVDAMMEYHDCSWRDADKFEAIYDAAVERVRKRRAERVASLKKKRAEQQQREDMLHELELAGVC